jgi:hypothetical protein
MKRIAQLLASLAAVAVLSACGTIGGGSAYEAGLKANVDQYKLFSDTQLAQQQTLQTCYAHNPNKSECSILTAATNAQQTLAGQPQALRVAKSQGEIIESLASQGMDATVKVYGIQAVRDAVVANANALRDTASAGMQAAAKDPLVVQPTIIEIPVPAETTPE